jgi:hypothetical protein
MPGQAIADHMQSRIVTIAKERGICALEAWDQFFGSPEGALMYAAYERARRS